jgi:hypothetical protein
LEDLRDPRYAARRAKIDIVTADLSGGACAQADKAFLFRAANDRKFAKTVALSCVPPPDVGDWGYGQLVPNALREAFLRIVAPPMLAQQMVIPVWKALYAKDSSSFSDQRMTNFLSAGVGNNSFQLSLPQMPRTYQIKEMRKATNAVVDDVFKFRIERTKWEADEEEVVAEGGGGAAAAENEDLEDEDEDLLDFLPFLGNNAATSMEECIESEDSAMMSRAVCSLEAAVRMQFYTAVAEGYLPPFNSHASASYVAKMKWKLSFDGTNIGDKPLLTFGVIPLGFGDKPIQSVKYVFPIAVGYVKESKWTLEHFYPGLKDEIARLHRDGLSVFSPWGKVTIPLEFSIAADLSALWKLTDIGSAQRDCSCLYCNSSKLQREKVGHEMCNIQIEVNRRKLSDVFGIPSSRIHICVLHALTRITEKLVRLTAMLSFNLELYLKHDVAAATKNLKQEEDRLKSLRRTSGGAGGGGGGRRPRGGAGAQQQQGTALLVDEAEQELRRLTVLRDEAVTRVENYGGSTDAMAAAVVSTGVLKRTFRIEAKEVKAGNRATVKTSTLTGGQARKLFYVDGKCKGEDNGGEEEEESGAEEDAPVRKRARRDPPFVEIVKAALGDCRHTEPMLNYEVCGAGDGVKKRFSCYTCAVLSIFDTFATKILPVLNARTPTRLAELGFNRDEFHGVVQSWGRFLYDVFTGGGCVRIISDYCKSSSYTCLCDNGEHSAYYH